MSLAQKKKIEFIISRDNMKNSQLIKRNHIAGGYTKVYPIAYIQGITDGVTGKHLTDILQSFSHIYLPYEGSAKDTRTSLPDDYRRQGIWITYNSGDSIITEIYKGTADDLHNDVLFGEDANWERVPDLKYVQSNASKIPDGAILPEMLSPSILQLLSNGNTIYNVVDDEDLESNECNVIKFKDRVYNKELASGKGYKVLRKNWVNGKNILTQDMIANTNTIYEIRYDFDLNGAEITIPEGCALKFEGGSLNNGVLVGNNTYIDANNYQIFKENLLLHKYSFNKTSNNKIVLSYYVSNNLINTSKIILPSDFKYKKKVILSGKEKGSNSDYSINIVDIGTTLDVNNELILTTDINHPKVTFSNGKASVVQSTLNGTQVINLTSKNNIFTVPKVSRWLFFDNNGNVLEPGETIEDTNVYCTFLAKAVIDVTNTSFSNTAKISWFTGNVAVGNSKNLIDANDSSYNIQRALDSPMNIESDMVGYIRCDKPLYIEVSKKILLGNKIFPIEQQLSGAPQMGSIHAINGLLICSVTNNDTMLFIRNEDISIEGGGFSYNYSNDFNDTDFICKIDCDFSIKNLTIDTLLHGKIAENRKSYLTKGGIKVLLEDRTIGYFMESVIKGAIIDTIYSIYIPKETEYRNSWCTCISYYCTIWGFYQAVTKLSASNITFKFLAQGKPVIPLNEVDNYRFGEIHGETNVDIVFSDVKTTKTTDAYQPPYKRCLLEGNCSLSNSVYLDHYDRVLSTNKIVLSNNFNINCGNSFGYTLLHPKLNDFLAGLSTNNIIDSSLSYIKQFRNNGEFEMTSNDKMLDNPLVTFVDNMNLPLDFYLGINSNNYVNCKNVPENNDAIELYLVTKEGYKILETNCSKLTLNVQQKDFFNFKNVHIVIFNDNSVVRTIDADFTEYIDYGLTSIDIDFQTIFSATSILVRFYNPVTNKQATYYQFPKIHLWSLYNDGFYNKSGGDLYGNINIRNGNVKILDAERKNKVEFTYTSKLPNSIDVNGLKELANTLTSLNSRDITIRTATGKNLFYDSSTQTIQNLDGSYAIPKDFGTTESRPIFSVPNYYATGVLYRDTTIKKQIMWDGIKWVDSNGNPADARSYGSFAEKPLSSTGIKVGFEYLATDVRNANAIKGMVIYHKGNNKWIAPDGTPVTSVTSLAKDAILFNSVIHDVILGASTAGNGTSETVYYSSHLKCFVLKKDNTYYNNFDNVADWNDGTEEFAPKPYANKYYISKNNDRYKWNNTNLVMNEE